MQGFVIAHFFESHVNNGQLIYYHHEKWYSKAVDTKKPSEHYYLSHETFHFARNSFLR
jgi:hypothetical protein